jgi:hypothetical protein
MARACKGVEIACFYKRLAPLLTFAAPLLHLAPLLLAPLLLAPQFLLRHRCFYKRLAPLLLGTFAALAFTSAWHLCCFADSALFFQWVRLPGQVLWTSLGQVL